MRDLARRLAIDEEGATSIEYAILLSLIAAVIAAAARILGQRVFAVFQSFNSMF
jgi:Flp pilus assembly pilin Flp